MTTALIILGLLLVLIGFVGCLIPVVPGPILSFLALLTLAYAKNWEPYSATFLIIMGCAALIVTGLDYVVGVLGAKKFGASKWGLIGSVAGVLIGVFCFPPLGMLLGAIVGALAGELLAGKTGKAALRAGWGVFVGNVVGVGLKLAFCGIMLFFYIKALF